MNKNKNIFAAILIMIAAFLASPLKAQVTIGTNTPPQSFSLLELISANRGMRLPQLNDQQRDALEASADFQAMKTKETKGLTIFNTSTNCWETWNGSQWIDLCKLPLMQPNPAGGTVCYGETWDFPLGAAIEGGSGAITYQWQSSPDNSNWTNIAGATNADYTTPALTANRYYRRIATRDGNSVTSNSALVTVYANLTAGTIGSAQTICYNTAPAAFTQLTTPTGGTGTYTYQWQSSFDGTAWTNIANATAATYTSSALTATAYFRRNVSSGSCGTVNSPSVMVTVNTVPGTPDAMTLSAFAVELNGTFTASVPVVSGATSYLWTLPADGGLTAPSLTTTAPVLTITGKAPTNTTYGTSSITVRAVNTCGQSAAARGNSDCITVYTGCGAYTDNCTWRAFDCFNLGGTTTPDPFTPTWQTNGAYYEWGRKDPAASAPNAAGADATAITWNTSYPTGWFGASGTADPGPADIVKSADDPCPAGFRVPNYNEWAGVISNQLNKITFVGSWTTATNSVTNWAGIKFGPALMLPAAGIRSNPAGALSYRGNIGLYWTSRFSRISAEHDKGAYYLRFQQSTDDEFAGEYDSGMSIRCIAQ